MTTTIVPDGNLAGARSPIRPRARRDWSVIAAVLAKDLTAIRRAKAVMLPMIIVPAVVLVGLPAGVGVFARTKASPDLSGLMEHLPSAIHDRLVGLTPQQQLITVVLGYLVAPLFLIVPMMVSAALAADTFAGEKERRTLEGLLHLPVDDQDLFLAKVLSAFIPATIISWAAFVVFALVIDAIAWPVLHQLLVPTAGWIVLIGWVTPAVASLALGIMVRVSARANTSQAANQLGGAVIMPLILLAMGQATGLLMIDTKWIVCFGAVVWVLAGLLIRGGMRRFRRNDVAALL